MSTESSRSLMDQYFTTMNNDGDFGRQMSDDVVWTTVESGEQVRGRAAVTEFVRALHGRMSDVHSHTFAVDDATALVEGDCVAAHTVASGDRSAPTGRIPYAVVYDIALDHIVAMRLYMQVSRLAARPERP